MSDLVRSYLNTIQTHFEGQYNEREIVMKKIARRVIVLLLVIATTLGFSVTELRATETEKGEDIHPTDVYIVLDNSYSMGGDEGSDPNRLAIQCADSFFTESPAGNSAIGILTFSGKVETIENLVANTGVDEKESWDAIYTQTGVNTNIGGAVRTAGQKLISDGTNPYKAIVLITDGVSKDGEDYEPVKYNGNPIPVYCIFINDGTSEDEEGARAFLGDIAERSGTGEIHEITSGSAISDEMHRIAAALYNLPKEAVDEKTIPLKGGPDGKWVGTETYTMPDDIYEFNCTIEHDITANFDLTIKDPNGKALYENKKTGSNYVTAIDNDAMTTVKILWPVSGDYTFEMVSDQEQTIKWRTIQIVASLDLSLDNTTVKAGEDVIASYTIKGNTQSRVVQASIRVHDQNGDVMDDSTDSGTRIVLNPDGTFTINTESFTDGAYDVVAIADMDDGKQIASVRKPFTVSGRKLALPIPLPALIGIIVLVLAAIGLAVKKILMDGSSRTVYVSPAAGNLNINLRVDGALKSTISLQLPMGLPGGKPQNLKDIFTQEVDRKHGDINLIPEELTYYNLCCMGEKGGADDQQQIMVTDNAKNLVATIPYDSTGTFEAGENIVVQFRWAPMRKANRGDGRRR